MAIPTLAVPDTARRTKAKKATGVAAFGTFIEYYDFSVYGYVAATLAIVFFPGDDPVIGLLNTLLVFGSAFIVRPLGAVFFGRLGDRKGRRTSLIASITCMGIAATLTGLLPGYAQIGVLAPILLVLLRMLQGFSTGGEIGGAAAYIHEWAAPNRRSLFVSLIPSVAQLGKGLAAGLAALAAAMMPAADLAAWGWRIPFLLALPLGILCLVMRLKVEDSPEFQAINKTTEGTSKAPFKEVLTKYPKALAKVTTISLVQNLGTYIGTVFVAVYFSEVLGFTKGEASTIVLLAVLFAALLIPMAGQLGSRIGSKKVLLWAYVAYVAITIPSFAMMNQGSFVLALLGLGLGIIPYALCQAGTYGAMLEFYPTRVRHTGVAFGHSVGAVIGGGAGPYLATYLIDLTGNTFVPAFILVGAGALGLLVVGLTVRANTDLSSHLYR
ncbi:putative major facilitator superfamily transporter [Arthrobacter globiformis NBRC 12137]|uniref:Putative major facilitator superfamily transporter n=1 Tax=Arthrobacter globiformis (strain ATCC 8010 / DSM 20124 / JCM 1332 / NBRC 12137 / NCIMB 8907 / NRRL B-2979 / 168) TaxID=1077972 RepID=H0QT90_ARTG1|nr:MFS transporter [Arthrobacter globiformis]GAB16041.1 putative major facilitator superfamily transporter [Arthrobacter globiformis NBRC 12137]